jgi:hypothetical protein
MCLIYSLSLRCLDTDTVADERAKSSVESNDCKSLSDFNIDELPEIEVAGSNNGELSQ